jgi:tetratricopeptide (TPR) repeat protein
MVYAYLQQGRDGEAWQVVSRTLEATRAAPGKVYFYGAILGYNAIAMPSRYALERSAWAEAARVAVPPDAAPYVEAVARFTRAIGQARSGQPGAARAEIAVLAALRDTLAARGDAYWATVVGAQRLAAEAWVAQAESRKADAVDLARRGAELEETVEKHPITPGPLLPARELEADLLMELGRPADALRSYDLTLAREPGRARALYGAARAAARAGNREVARSRFEALARLMAHADSTRNEPGEARAYLAGG